MDTVKLPPFHVPTVSISGFEEKEFPLPHQLIYDEAGKASLHFEFAPYYDSVSVLLFHRQKRRFMVMRQFRPEVFVSRVMQLPANRGKGVGDIQWTAYKRDMGCTMELCTGQVMDIKWDIDDTAVTVAEQGCGVRVDKNCLEFIEKIVTSVTESGSTCHLYYAEIDNAEYIGNADFQRDGSFQTVWLSMAMAEDVCKRQKDPLVSSLHYYAFMWWFQTKYQSVRAASLAETARWIDTRSEFSDRRQLEAERRQGRLAGKLRFEQKITQGFTMNYQILGVDQEWDITFRPDMVSILIKDDDSSELILTRRSRPAVLVGRARTKPENEGKPLSEINFKAYPGVWAFTQELASGRMLDSETPEQAVLRVASVVLGYHVPLEELKFVARLLKGSSTAGESMYLYYAECKAAHRVENWKEWKRIKRVAIPRWSASCRLSPHSSPPSVLIMREWMIWNERRPTEDEQDDDWEELMLLELEIENADKARREEESAERLAQWNRDQAELKEKKEREAAAGEEGGEEDPMEEGDGGNRKRVAQELEEFEENFLAFESKRMRFAEEEYESD